MVCLCCTLYCCELQYLIVVWQECRYRDNVQEFLWKQLENIYFRDKKFSVQVHDASSKRYVLSFVILWTHYPKSVEIFSFTWSVFLLLHHLLNSAGLPVWSSAWLRIAWCACRLVNTETYIPSPCCGSNCSAWQSYHCSWMDSAYSVYQCWALALPVPLASVICSFFLPVRW